MLRAIGPPSILLVEDDEDSRALTAMALEHIGYEVVTCANGAEAIDRLEDTYGSGLPAAIVLDWMMPVMTGPDLVARLAAHPRWATIPIVVVSAVALLVKPRGAIVAALQKPVRIAQLRAAVEGAPRVVGAQTRARAITAS